MIDSTIIRANQCSEGYKKNSQEECLGKSRGELGTKVHDITQAENLTKELKDTTIIADKGYDS